LTDRSTIIEIVMHFDMPRSKIKPARARNTGHTGQGLCSFYFPMVFAKAWSCKVRGISSRGANLTTAVYSTGRREWRLQCLAGQTLVSTNEIHAEVSMSPRKLPDPRALPTQLKLSFRDLRKL
jgi:hypothetical protein